MSGKFKKLYITAEQPPSPTSLLSYCPPPPPHTPHPTSLIYSNPIHNPLLLSQVLLHIYEAEALKTLLAYMSIEKFNSIPASSILRFLISSAPMYIRTKYWETLSSTQLLVTVFFPHFVSYHLMPDNIHGDQRLPLSCTLHLEDSNNVRSLQEVPTSGPCIYENLRPLGGWDRDQGCQIVKARIDQQWVSISLHSSTRVSVWSLLHNIV